MVKEVRKVQSSYEKKQSYKCNGRQKVPIGNIWKKKEKAEEYYNYINTSLGFRRGFMLHDEQQGQSIMTNIADVIERFKILYGEITSGNKNINLINEI